MSLSWELRAKAAEAEVARLRMLLDRPAPVKRREYPWTLSKHSRDALRRAFNSLPTRRESYMNGMRTGLDWDAPWPPGGPWVYSKSGGGRSNEPGWNAYAARSAQNCELWKQGWRDGVAIKATLSQP